MQLRMAGVVAVAGLVVTLADVSAATWNAGASGAMEQSYPRGRSGGDRGEAAEAGKRMTGDQGFVHLAASDGMAEVEHGRLAAQNASSDEVRQFGQRMVADHGKANDELKALATKKGLQVPPEPDAKHKSLQAKLARLKGAQFDSAYMSHMVSAHAQALAVFERQVKEGKDAELKAWAEKTLPVLREHHKLAQSVAGTVKGAAKPSPAAPAPAKGKDK